jgi:hypothetical protein
MKLHDAWDFYLEWCTYDHEQESVGEVQNKKTGQVLEIFESD